MGKDIYRVRRTEVDARDDEIQEYQKTKKLPTVCIRDIDDTSYDSETEQIDMQESTSIEGSVNKTR